MSTVEEKIETTKSRLASGNLFAVIWIIIGTVGCWLVNPLFRWLFLGFSSFVILIIIRRMLCNSCYYCKSCTKGFAKLSILFLGTNRIPGLNKGSILRMTAVIFVILSVIPGLLIVNSILHEFTLLKFLALICLIAITLYAVGSILKNVNRNLWKLEATK